MPLLYWAGPTSSGKPDKCDWIVESLATQRNKYSRAVKVFDVREQLGKTFPNHAVDPVEQLQRLLADGHSTEYLRGFVRNRDDAAVWRSFGHFLGLKCAAIDVASNRGDLTNGRIVGSLGEGMHHARASASSRGQLFNGAAVVARALTDNSGWRSSGGVTAALILDLDGSCAGGTAAMISGIPRVRLIDVATNEIDAYADTANASLRIVSRASDYLNVVQESLSRLDVAKEKFPLCIYSAGVDGYELHAGGLPGMTAEVLAERDRLVFEWCRSNNLRTVYTTGGGVESESLSRDALVALHRQTVETAVRVLRAEQSEEKRSRKRFRG